MSKNSHLSPLHGQVYISAVMKIDHQGKDIIQSAAYGATRVQTYRSYIW